MKKVLTIFIAIILLASGLQVTIDRHYCGGKLADIKISVTGKLASCGMDQSESSCPDYPVINKKCCEDRLSVYKICSNYYPEYFRLTHPIWDKNFSATPIISFTGHESYNTDLIKWVLPPGHELKSSITQSEICVFRI